MLGDVAISPVDAAHLGARARTGLDVVAVICALMAGRP
jgi:hypothetical protein